jgi:hypothetical protein
MTRRKKELLRKFSEDEHSWLERISRSQSEPASHVMRAKQILLVSAGHSYTEAARLSGVKTGDTTASLISRFNQEGLNALQPRHAGGPKDKYGPSEREKILKEFRRKPEPETDGTATWSLKTLCAALRKAPDGLAEVSEDYNPHRITGERL